MDRPQKPARYLALEGSLQSLAQGLGESYLSAYALWLGAGGPVLGLVSSLPTASTALVQALARRLRAVGAGPRRLVVRAWALQAVAYAALGLCVGLSPVPAVLCLSLLIVVGWGAGGLAVPAWTALVSDTVPRDRHGWFFGLRGTAQQFGIVTAILGGGLLLNALARRGLEPVGFVALFLLAALARAGGTSLLAGVPEASRPLPRARASGFEALRASRRFRRLAVYLWVLHVGTHISTPFFVPYMLAELHWSYALIAALLAVPAMVKIVTVRAWGRVADRFGPGPLLRLSGWLVAPVPALWLLGDSPWWILTAQVISGLSWGGFDVAQASALLRTTRGRANAVGVFNLIDGGAILVGSLTGGTIVKVAHAFLGFGYLAPLLVSSIVRLLAAATLLRRVHGIGHPDWPHRDLPLRVWGFRPTRGVSLRPWSGPLRPDEDVDDESSTGSST